MENLDQKTGEFIATIKETNEFQSFEKSSELYKKDKDAQKLLEDFQMAQQTLAISQQGNFPGQQEQKEKVESLRKEVSKNEVIRDWIETQRNFQTLVGKLTINISNDLNFPFTLPQQSGGCCG